MADRRELKAHIWPKDPNEWYVEPEWCSDVLFASMKFHAETILDPAAGMCRIPEAAKRAGYCAEATDKIIRRAGVQQCNFLYEDPEVLNSFAIVSNPPFSIADAFVQRALSLADEVAMLLPLTWLAGAKRARWLRDTPLKHILVLTPRPSMPPGVAIEAGEKPGGGTVDFAWIVWDGDYVDAPQFGWLNRDG